MVVVSGDAGGRRQQHGHHGGPADHAERAFAEPGRLAMGGQCLSGRLRGLHRARRPGGGPVWRTAGIAGWIGAVRAGVLHHCHSGHGDRTACWTQPPGPRGSFRGAQHAGCRRYQRGARTQGSSDRRLDRVPDARLQHRAAARRRAHPRHKLARHLLAQRPAYVGRLCRSGVCSLGDRAC